MMEGCIKSESGSSKVEQLRSPCLVPVWTASIRLAPRKGRADGDQRRTDAINAQRVRADWTS